MKTRIVSIVLALAFVIMSTTCAFASSFPQLDWKTTKVKKGYTTQFYVNSPAKSSHKIYTSKKLKIKVVDERKLTNRLLTHRKNKYLLVVKIRAKVTNNLGDGKTLTGSYISYRSMENPVKGKTYITYIVYGNNNYTDDTVQRIDTWK